MARLTDFFARRPRLGAARTLVLAALPLFAACPGSQLKRELVAVKANIDQARNQGAYLCAPVELAMAESHYDFTAADLYYGDYLAAKDNFAVAERNAREALEKSPPNACKFQDERPVIVPKVGDRDGDGILDDVDKCPDDPEDKDGFEDEDGCPDPDNDQDGIMDADDACPNDKGEPSSDPKKNGCPSTDRDGDGIPNDQDKCPDQPETYNGVDDDDGCPDTGKARDTPLAELKETKRDGRVIVLRQPLAFTKKDGVELDARSQATLRAVAQLLNAHKGWSVAIAVRPPPGGDDLARSRAAAVAEVIRRSTTRTEAATTTAWQKGKMPVAAEVSGISVALVASEGK